MFAGTAGGIFRSTDGGSSWTLAGGTAGVGGAVVRAASDQGQRDRLRQLDERRPADPIDGGATWKPLNAGLDDSIVRDVTIDRNDPNVLWAGTDSAGVFVATSVALC